jgi:hypothetical protein
MFTNIPIDSYPKGITLYTNASPTLEQLRDAVARFHEFPLLDGSPFVVLGNPFVFAPQDRIALHRIGILGFEEIEETEIDLADGQQ